MGLCRCVQRRLNPATDNLALTFVGGESAAVREERPGGSGRFDAVGQNQSGAVAVVARMMSSQSKWMRTAMSSVSLSTVSAR